MPDGTAVELPNLWRINNLRESPYFQETLGGEPLRQPLSLFVGRTRELKQLLTTIGSSASSRQAVGGPPGIGKTTLAQAVKAEAIRGGYFATDGILPFYPNDTADLVLGRILGAIYDALLTARPHTAETTPMQEAQQMVRALRLRSGGGSFSVLGVGGGATISHSAVTPPNALLLDGPRVIRDLLAVVASTEAKGIVVHLNNLENLSERDTHHAAEILRSLRDPVLLQPRLHLLLVGTTEAVTTVATGLPQLRSVFTTPLILEPMTADHVGTLLEARYEYLRLDTGRPAVPPIAPEAVAALYPLFRGDLRGLLKALEEGASLLLGVSARGPGVPIALDELRSALATRYQVELAAALEDARARQLQAWAEVGPDSVQTQESLGTLWGITQGSVSIAVRNLIGQGYMLALPRRGSDPIRYVLSGVSRLVFG
jgi:hypothetical protein